MPAKYTRAAIFPIGPSVAYIPLTMGQFSLVDWDDALWLERDAWHAKYEPSNKSFYAVRMCQRKVLKMHRVLLQTPVDMVGDHINRNPLDNRRCNLRLATRQQNNCNLNLRCDNTTGHRGISFDRNRWLVQVQGNGKKVRKRCKTLKEAIEVRNHAAKSLHGRFADAGFLPRSPDRAR